MPPPREVLTKQASNDEKRVIANRYRIEKKLGSGNYGTAYLVTDLRNNDELKVLKEVSVGEMQPDETIESVHEANLLSKLDNPYIVRYHDSFLDGEYFCIITEYCEGGDLDVRFKKLKKENKKLSEQQVLDWFVQLLSAVNYMHSRRVLHRDLKARNIFLRNEIIRIGDFGISRILMGTMDMATTFTGTPYYMSPEVLKHEGYNSKSDVWSVGCLLYEMCTLQHAFEGQGLMGVMYKIVEGKVPDLPNTYSKELGQILKKIFCKDPNDRPSTSELLKEPFIANHVRNMIERLSTNSLNNLESTIVVKNAAADIAKVMSNKYYAKDLRTPNPAKIENLPNQSSKQSTVAAAEEEKDDDETNEETLRPVSTSLPQTIGGNKTMKELTPKERLLLNKLKKSDKEARKLGQVAKENLEERYIRDSFRREATMHSSSQIKPSPGGYSSLNSDPNYQMVQQYLSQTYQKNNINAIPSSGLPIVSSSSNKYSFDSSDDEDGTILKTVQNNKKTSSPPVKDDRPIKPMKANIESSFNEDGIPIDPNVTNEYYNNFSNEFEVDSSPERMKPTLSYSSTNTRNSLSKTVVPANKRRPVTGKQQMRKQPSNNDFDSKKSTNFSASKTISTNQPRSSVASRNEYEQLINALNTKSILSDTFGDDSYHGAFGIHARDTKIQNLRAQAIRLLGESSFKKCYEFLKNEDFSDENRKMENLSKLMSHPSDAFLVEQLIFLEEQSK